MSLEELVADALHDHTPTFRLWFDQSVSDGVSGSSGRIYELPYDVVTPASTGEVMAAGRAVEDEIKIPDWHAVESLDNHLTRLANDSDRMLGAVDTLQAKIKSAAIPARTRETLAPLLENLEQQEGRLRSLVTDLRSGNTRMTVEAARREVGTAQQEIALAAGAICDRVRTSV